MSWFHRLIDVIARRPSPPNDDRSLASERLDALAVDAAATLDRVDRLVPPQHRRSLTERMRAESLAGAHRVRR